ncbi:hypothetical protein LAZ67_X003052 [Cordylochernes scorpioides]|uniref:Transposase n=1 Tax=Cordylochernes scorpioides TaxID=51811 RepID=A0ABY6LTU4_9ARAC|nr:hypothetical protein LAZ67_X003052 [Cordylochernes scorpioides]
MDYSSKRRPCRICLNRGHAGRFHPENRCWFRERAVQAPPRCKLHVRAVSIHGHLDADNSPFERMPTSSASTLLTPRSPEIDIHNGGLHGRDSCQLEYDVWTEQPYLAPGNASFGDGLAFYDHFGVPSGPHRMNIANEMLDSVRDEPNLLQRVITGDEAGVVHHEFLPQGRTVNKEYYLQVMRNLREAIRQKRPDLWKNKNWLLHHDNAPAHTSLLVCDFLAKNNTLMMPQPPYSPDLAPCDFFLFPKLNKLMKGRRYATLDEIKTASKEELKNILKNDFFKGFEDWKNRWHNTRSTGHDNHELLLGPLHCINCAGTEALVLTAWRVGRTMCLASAALGIRLAGSSGKVGRLDGYLHMLISTFPWCPEEAQIPSGSERMPNNTSLDISDNSPATPTNGPGKSPMEAGTLRTARFVTTRDDRKGAHLSPRKATRPPEDLSSGAFRTARSGYLEREDRKDRPSPSDIRLNRIINMEVPVDPFLLIDPSSEARIGSIVEESGAEMDATKAGSALEELEHLRVKKWNLEEKILSPTTLQYGIERGVAAALLESLKLAEVEVCPPNDASPVLPRRETPRNEKTEEPARARSYCPEVEGDPVQITNRDEKAVPPSPPKQPVHTRNSEMAENKRKKKKRVEKLSAKKKESRTEVTAGSKLDPPRATPTEEVKEPPPLKKIRAEAFKIPQRRPRLPSQNPQRSRAPPRWKEDLTLVVEWSEDAGSGLMLVVLKGIAGSVPGHRYDLKMIRGGGAVALILKNPDDKKLAVEAIEREPAMRL